MKKIIIVLFFLCHISFSNNFEKLNKFYMESKEYNLKKLNEEIKKLENELISDNNNNNNNSDNSNINNIYNLILKELNVNEKSNKEMLKGIDKNNINFLINSVNYDHKNILSFLSIILNYDKIYSINEMILLYKQIIKNDDLVDFTIIYSLLDYKNEFNLKNIYKNNKFKNTLKKNSFEDILYLQNSLPKSIKNYIYINHIINSLNIKNNNIKKLIKFIDDFNYLMDDSQVTYLYNKFIEYNILLAYLALEHKKYEDDSKKFDEFLSKFIKNNNLNILNNLNIDKNKF